MTDTPKKSWFGLITPSLLGRVSGRRYDIDPHASDEFKGDARNRFQANASSGYTKTVTTDVYAQAEGERDVHRRR